MTARNTQEVMSTLLQTSSSGIYTIVKLSDLNWVDFKEKKIFSLNARGLSRHLNIMVKVPKPLPMATGDPTKIMKSNRSTPATEVDIEVNLTLLDQYIQWESLAIQQFYTTIPSNIMIQVKSKTTAAEKWKAMCAIHEAKSDMVQADLCARLQNMRCGEKDDIKIHQAGGQAHTYAIQRARRD